MTIVERTDGRDAAAARIQPCGETVFTVLDSAPRLGVARRVAWAVTIVVAIAMTFALSWGAAVSRAADYQDGNGNVCEGSSCFNGSLVANGAFDNVAFGPSMMNALTSGDFNVAIGPSALDSNTSGSHNLASGTSALEENTTGGNNLASGYQALFSNTTGSDNLASGTSALEENTTGSNNLASGADALFANKTGTDNVAGGFDALQANTTGSDNLASGVDALLSNTTGNFNVASGASALASNTTGHDNLASGVDALFANTTGKDNVASGSSALRANTTGNFNLASGADALLSNTTGSDNLASGFLALDSNTSGSDNVASGSEALFTNATGAQNVASGYQALHHDTGAFNTALGASALSANTTGGSNLALGRLAGSSLTTGSNNIEIANNGVAGEARTTRIGTQGTQMKAFLSGVTGVSIPGPTQAVLVNSSGQLGTATSSSARLKQDIRPLAQTAGLVLELHPVSYRYRPAYAPAGNPLQYGLIAEQVKRVFPALVQYGPDRKPSGVYYQELPVLLLAQLQSEHARVSRQQREIGQLAAQLEALRALVVHHH